MPEGLDRTFGGLGHLLGVCLCCGDLFYLSENLRRAFPSKQRWYVSRDNMVERKFSALR